MTDPQGDIDRAIEIIDLAQQTLWNLHLAVKAYNEELGMNMWQQTLQIEHAIKVLRNHRIEFDNING